MVQELVLPIDASDSSRYQAHLLRYRWLVSGANTAVSAADAASTQPTCPALAVPAIRPRVAVTRWLTGLTSMKACSQPGMVWGSTKMLLARVRGNSTSRLRLLTALGARSTSPRVVQIHDRPNANTRTSPTAATVPAAPPSGREPSTRPRAMTIVAASR